MDSAMKIAIMERDTPELLKQLDLGEVKVEVKKSFKRFLFFKKEIGKYFKVSSDVLYKLEETSKEFLEKGHEVLKSIFVKDGKYNVLFSYETNPNSSYLERKRTIEKLRRIQTKLIKKSEEANK